MTIVNDLLGTAVNPYTRIAKLIAIGAAIAGVIAFIWSWHDRGRQIETLEVTQTAIVEAATLATVPPDKDGKRDLLEPEQVPAAIAALATSLKSADSVLRSISERTMTAKAASDAADKALARDLEQMRERLEQTDLENWDPWNGE